MLLRGNFGLAALLTGDTDDARRAFREKLALCRQLVVLPFAFEGLIGLAAVATVRGNLDRARDSPARLPHTASAPPWTPSTLDLTRPSSSPPAPATELTIGMPPPARERR